MACAVQLRGAKHGAQTQVNRFARKDNQMCSDWSSDGRDLPLSASHRIPDLGDSRCYSMQREEWWDGGEHLLHVAVYKGMAGYPE